MIRHFDNISSYSFISFILVSIYYINTIFFPNLFAKIPLAIITLLFLFSSKFKFKQVNSSFIKLVLLVSLYFSYHILKNPEYIDVYTIRYFYSIFVLFSVDALTKLNFLERLLNSQKTNLLYFILTLAIIIFHYPKLSGYSYPHYNINGFTLILLLISVLQYQKSINLTVLLFSIAILISILTFSLGSILIGMSIIFFWIFIHYLKNISSDKLASLVVAAYALLSLLLIYTAIINFPVYDGLYFSKRFLLRDLMPYFFSMNISELLFGYRFFYSPSGESDFEYMSTIIEIFFKFGLFGLALLFISAYQIIKKYFHSQQYQLITIFCLSSMIFGAGILTYQIYSILYIYLYLSKNE